MVILKILLHTEGATSSNKFMSILAKFSEIKMDLCAVNPAIYVQLHRLIDARLPTDYFLKEFVTC